MAAVTFQEASSFTSQRAYDVFLSFGGEDTRKTFIEHLYTALLRAGFHTFREDVNMERGANIISELQGAIRQSMISIVVFSKTYVSSSWCLDELLMIFERKRTSKHIVLPVFYDVDPSQVRMQTGTFAEAFTRHKRRLKAEAGGRNNEWIAKVKQWRAALREAADLGGMVLQNRADGYAISVLQNRADGHESKFIQEIVSIVKDKVNHTALGVAPFLIGIYHRAEKINLWVRDRSADVGVVAICGIGGIGKTTIAKYVYNLNFKRFEGSSFLANIREVSEQPNGVVRLQRQFVYDILNWKKEKIFNVDKGTVKIKDAISCKRVLLVLDDVDKMDQVDAMFAMRHWLRSGSKIIITTRNEPLLEALKVYKVHKIEKLDKEESLELFSWHAFGRDHPSEGYMWHSRRLVHHCRGVPLALQVLGSSLFGKGIDEWESALERLEANTDGQILRILQISFDSLQDDHDKNLFLHITCFFVGKDKDCTIQILDGCDFYTSIGIQNLIDRHLLTIDNSNKIMLHQLLRDMGREIIRQESPKKPWERSRLWRYEDSFSVLVEKTGSETIEGLVLDMQPFKEVNSAQMIFSLDNAKEYFQKHFDKSSWKDQGNPLKQYHFGVPSLHRVDSALKYSNEIVLETKAFARMRKLRLLQLSSVQLSGSYEEFPRGLKWLCWRGYPLESIPIDFPLESLVSLEMRYSSLKQVWKGTKFLGLLKVLNLSHSHNLAKTPNFSGLPNLERLILKDCTSLVKVHESIGLLDRLVFLNLKDCKNLRKLPQRIGVLKSLETLILFGCSKLDKLPTGLGELESLKVFADHAVAINLLLRTTLRGLVSMPKRSPEISFASSSQFPDYSLSRASSSQFVDILSLENCNMLDNTFAEDLSSPQVRTLQLKQLPSLPYSFCNLIRLRTLQLEQLLIGLRTLQLEQLPSLPYSFRNLVGLRMLQLEQLPNLEELKYVGWEKNAFQSVMTSEEIIKILGLPDLASMENIEKVEKVEMVMTFMAQGVLHEYGLFSIFFPGREVPIWFSHVAMGSSISFTVPSLPYLKVQGMNVCSVYAFSDENKDKLPDPLFAKIINKSKGRQWIYGPSCFGVPKDDGHMTWLSHWKLGNQFDSGDEVTLSICADVGFEVKVCGINLVYEKVEMLGMQENTPNPSHQGVIDLSSCKVITGTYFLCDVISKANDWSGSGWFDKLIRDSDNTSGKDLSQFAILPKCKSGQEMMAKQLPAMGKQFLENLNENYSYLKEHLNLLGEKVLEAPSFEPREKEELEEMTPNAKEWVEEEMNFVNEKLLELPKSPNCPFLKKLFLQGNDDLMVIPPSFFECMPVLEVLDLSYTNIKILPKSISKLVGLQKFFLRGCDLLMELPPEIGALANLEVFDLQGTKIMYLPKEIGEMVRLTSFKVSFNECANPWKENNDVNTIIPRKTLSNLSQLIELSIDVPPNSGWWDVEVITIVDELCSLKNLRNLKLYVPIVESLKDLKWDNISMIYPALTHFRFIVGRQEQCFISRLPDEVEEEFDNSEKLEKGLKYVNGEGIPIEITKVLQHADAFFLKRHWTVKNLSEFGVENMEKLKFCFLAECNEFQSIIDAKQIYQRDCEENNGDESEHVSNFGEEILLGSLEYLSIHYMRNMESICKGPVRNVCLSNLKSLALHTCPSLTTVFTVGMLSNMIFLEKLIVEDCPKMNSLASVNHSSLKSGRFLPSLKKISLLELPELVSISSGLCIAPKLESMVIFYCPKLEILSSIEVASKDLKVIKGENEWWGALKWQESDMSSHHLDYLAGIFIPLSWDGDLMDQLTED